MQSFPWIEILINLERSYKINKKIIMKRTMFLGPTQYLYFRRKFSWDMTKENKQ